MVKKITQYKTKDGQLWDNYEEAKKHEMAIGAKVFDSPEEMWSYIEKTIEWNEWLSRYNKDEPDVYFAMDEAQKVGDALAKDHSKVTISHKKGEYQQKMNWRDFIWIKFKPVVLFDYFKYRTKDADLTDAQVHQLCQLAERDAYSSSLNDIMDVLDGLIDAVNIVFEK